MKISTYQFGEIEFDETMVMKFEEGVIGFENLKKYLLVSQEDGLFYWLTSVEEPEIVFPLFPARLIYGDYTEADDFEAFGIVRLDKDPANVTINLKAPVYINQEKKTGYQKIYDNDKYPIDYHLFIES